MKDYLTVPEVQSAEIIVRRSRFVATIANVKDTTEAIAFINEIKARYGDATHNCYAYILEDTDMKCSDDGEPQGTAGAPILEVLKKNQFKQTAIAVTRYFGGVKLGSKGLIGAYSASAAKVAATAYKVQMVYSDYYTIELDYNQKEKLDIIIKKNMGEIQDTVYLQSVITEFVVPSLQSADLAQGIQDLTSGKGDAKKIKSGYFGYSIKR